MQHDDSAPAHTYNQLRFWSLYGWQDFIYSAMGPPTWRSQRKEPTAQI